MRASEHAAIPCLLLITVSVKPDLMPLMRTAVLFRLLDVLCKRIWDVASIFHKTILSISQPPRSPPQKKQIQRVIHLTQIRTPRCPLLIQPVHHRFHLFADPVTTSSSAPGRSNTTATTPVDTVHLRVHYPRTSPSHTPPPLQIAQLHLTLCSRPTNTIPPLNEKPDTSVSTTREPILHVILHTVENRTLG